ncbi:hypothetical protein [Mycolicibacterium sphagni]|uniref:hypothetical protein n=1 Tax=Mycolicibacterium sphagni TaxID=1786 RepID=UPI0021F363C5|nr:hypothetical protein [Mycolicibacterium sphagni]MCV7174925.1 hypothetical protein [Mycolicibacterium sphagni]
MPEAPQPDASPPGRLFSRGKQRESAPVTLGPQLVSNGPTSTVAAPKRNILRIVIMVVSTLLQAAGLAAITACGFAIAWWLGLLLTGISLLVAGWALGNLVA